MRGPIFITHDAEEPKVDDPKTSSWSTRPLREKLYEIETKRNAVNSDSFEAMNLKPDLLRGIYAHGIECPSPLHQHGIEPILKGQDVIIQAQAAPERISTLAISVLQKLNTSNTHCQAVILVPTQIAYDIQKAILALGKFMTIQCHVCVGGIGGTSIREDSDRLRRGSHIVVGTLGRVLDMVNRGILKPDSIKMLAMDEGMLSRSFMDLVRDFYKQLPPSVQLIFLSGSFYSNKAMAVATNLVRDPIRVTVKKEESPVKSIKQFYAAVEEEADKLDRLCSLCQTNMITQAVIFCNTRAKIEWLAENLTARNLTVSAIHRGIEEAERDVLMRQFRSGLSRFLIATDLLGCGFDVQHVSLVINYDLPPRTESYTRRSGLQGRFGQKGVTLNFVTNEDKPMLKEIEQFHSIQILEMPMNMLDLL
ncbi:MAG: eukaryotic initiation factor 4A-like protein [Benniella sp.]|nr:MAG: eukaryotic initiation factor 4A-like protein [Benniella sp.]